MLEYSLWIKWFTSQRISASLPSNSFYLTDIHAFSYLTIAFFGRHTLSLKCETVSTSVCLIFSNINGYRFHTQARDVTKKTQNYGVMVEGNRNPYHGKIIDTIELDYFFEGKVVLFWCDCVDVNSSWDQKEDKRGFILLNFSQKMHKGSVLKDYLHMLPS